MKKLYYILLLVAFYSCKDLSDEVKLAQNIQQLTHHSEDISTVKISEDGNTIYYTIHKNKSSTDNGDSDLYSINSDGSNNKKILTYPANTGIEPIISKNGKLLAFTSYKNTSTGGQAELVVGNIDGTNLRTFFIHNGSLPVYAFVDNDNSILYGKSMRLSNCECNTIWKRNLEGSENIKISNDNNAVVADVSDENNLILVDTYLSAYSMNYLGRDTIQLGTGFTPRRISPLNSSFLLSKDMLAASSTPSTRNYFKQVFVVDTNGANLRQLTNSDMNNYPVDYFPDGQQVLFLADKNGRNENERELYSIKLDGSGLKRLTANDYYEEAYGFLEKSKKVLFTSRKDGYNNLYVLNLN